MNSKQRRKLIRKYAKAITLLRVKSRLAGGDGFRRFTTYELARDFENSPTAEAIYNFTIGKEGLDG